MSKLLAWLKRSKSKEEEEEEEPFLARRMKAKLSMYKCLDCEQRSKKEGIPYLFHRVARGKRCPVCNSHNLQKISIYAVMELRWNKAVKRRLAVLKIEKNREVNHIAEPDAP